MYVRVLWEVSVADIEDGGGTVPDVPGIVQIPDHLIASSDGESTGELVPEVSDPVADWLSDKYGWLVAGWEPLPDYS